MRSASSLRLYYGRLNRPNTGLAPRQDTQSAGAFDTDCGRVSVRRVGPASPVNAAVSLDSVRDPDVIWRMVGVNPPRYSDPLGHSCVQSNASLLYVSRGLPDLPRVLA